MAENNGNGNCLAARLKRTRIRRKMNQTELAELAGVSRASISMWEAGKTADPKPQLCVQLADALGVNIRWLITGAGPMEGKPAVLDPAVLRAIMIGVNQSLEARNKSLSAKKHAQLVTLLYEHITATGQQVTRHVIENFTDITHPAE